MGSALRLAPIEAGKAYPLAVFSEISGLNKTAIRSMRRDGFVVRKLGTRNFVEGEVFLQFLRERGKIVGSQG